MANRKESGWALISSPKKLACQHCMLRVPKERLVIRSTPGASVQMMEAKAAGRLLGSARYGGVYITVLEK